MAVSRCSVCHRLLTDSYSVAVQIGPECRGRMLKSGYRFPKPKYQVRHGRVELIGMTGKIVPPTGGRDEKTNLVRRILRDGGKNGYKRAVAALGDYMREKDAPMPLTWCARYVMTVCKEESDDEANNESD
jgi:hypothetical protein